MLNRNQVAALTALSLVAALPSFAQKPSPAPKAKPEMCKDCPDMKGAKAGAKKPMACAAPITLSLSGLHCGGCEQSVAKALQAIPGVESATVSSKTQRAVVWVCGKKTVKQETLTAAVVKAGYKVTKVAKGEARP